MAFSIQMARDFTNELVFHMLESKAQGTPPFAVNQQICSPGGTRRLGVALSKWF